MDDEGGDLLAENAEGAQKEVAEMGVEGEKSAAEAKNVAVKEEGAKEDGVEGPEVKEVDQGDGAKEGGEEEGDEAEGVLTEPVKKKRTVRKFIKKEALEGEKLEEEQGEEQGEWVLEEMSEESLQGEGILNMEPSLMGEGFGEEEEGEENEKEHFGEEQQPEEEQEPETPPAEEHVEEEYQYFEEVIDPAAPYNFTDSDEALKKPFKLKPEQLAEVEQLWEVFQNHTPAYCNLDGFITAKELIYMLKSIMLMPFTEDQMHELIEFCVKPPHPNGHINFDQFVKIVTLRKRDFPLEEELRASLQLMDPEKTGSVDRAYLKEVIATMGYKMPPRMLDNMMKEVDMANDGTIGIEDVIGTIMMDLNRDDINMLMTLIYPDEDPVYGEEAEDGEVGPKDLNDF